MAGVDTSELRTFLIVSEFGSFSRAAVRLGVPQPTLSRHIARLEEELGSRLFYRHGRGVLLTDAGLHLSSAVQPLVRRLDEVRHAIAAQSGEPTGFLRFAVTPAVGRSMAASVVAAFRARCPQVHMHVVEAFAGTVREWLESGWADVAILYGTPAQGSDALTLMKEHQVLVSLPGSAPAQDPVPLQDIDPRRLILFGRGAGRRATEAAFEAAGILLDAPLVVDSIATMKRLVEQDDLLAILPFGAVHREVADGRLAARQVSSPVDMSVLLVARTAVSKPVTAAARALLDVLRAEATRLLAEGRPGFEPHGPDTRAG